MTQKNYILTLCENNKDAIIIGSIGTISYDLKEIDHPNKILVKGAMGSVMGIGLGYALAQPKKKVIVIVGDGAFLMKMGTMATIEHYKPLNLKIIIMDNGRFASCGEQKTNFSSISGMINSLYYEVVKV